MALASHVKVLAMANLQVQPVRVKVTDITIIKRRRNIGQFAKDL